MLVIVLIGCFVSLSFIERPAALERLARILDKAKLLTYSLERSPSLVWLALDSIDLDTSWEEADTTKLEYIKRTKVTMG